MKNTKKANEVCEVYFILVIVSELLIIFPGMFIVYLIICNGLKLPPELFFFIWLILLPIPIIFLMVKYVKALNEPIDQESEVKIRQTSHLEPQKNIQLTSQSAKNVTIDI